MRSKKVTFLDIKLDNVNKNDFGSKTDEQLTEVLDEIVKVKGLNSVAKRKLWCKNTTGKGGRVARTAHKRRQLVARTDKHHNKERGYVSQEEKTRKEETRERRQLSREQTEKSLGITAKVKELSLDDILNG